MYAVQGELGVTIHPEGIRTTFLRNGVMLQKLGLVVVTAMKTLELTP